MPYTVHGTELLEYKLIDHLYHIEVRVKRNSFVLGSFLTSVLNSTAFYKLNVVKKCWLFLFINVSTFKFVEYNITQKNFDALFWLFIKDRNIYEEKLVQEDVLINKYL